MNFFKQLIKHILKLEARLVLKKYTPRIIAITGSVGKTTTRDAIYLVLSRHYFVRKSEKSFTTELGVPLSILGCSQGTGTALQWLQNILVGLRLILIKKQYPEWLILEIDGHTPGEFTELATWLTPDILVVTAVGDVPAHVEAFGTVEKLLAEKKILVDSVARDGVIVYNIDDTHACQLVGVSGDHTADHTPVRKISCGIHIPCDVRATEPTILYGKGAAGQIPTGISFSIQVERISSPISILNTIGVHHVYACALAYAVGQELGISDKDCVKALAQCTSQPGRIHIIAGLKESTIIDDSYNASPVAMQQALDTFADIAIEKKKRKIGVLGDMLELGKYSIDEHKKLAPMLVDSVDYAILVGIRSRSTAEELLSLGFDESHILTVDTSVQAGKELQNILETGDMVLVKGSQAMRMERVVYEVMRHPTDAATLLTRQEPEWLSRE